MKPVEVKYRFYSNDIITDKNHIKQLIDKSNILATMQLYIVA